MINNKQTEDNKTLKLKDIPAGSALARSLNINYGDIDFNEPSGELFFFGRSIWGIARIGPNKEYV